MNNTAQDFLAHRPLLLGLAYRMLGSMWDAEDVVQESYLRWLRSDRAEIRHTRAFLITTVSRIALDHLKSARVTREAYRGPWLPEPVLTDALGPLDTAELRNGISFATLHLMERLSPPERAIFVLREAFAMSFDEIAEILGMTAASCRQIHHRSAPRLTQERERFQPAEGEHAKLLHNFLDAAQNGNLASLTAMLNDDVTAWNDGGGKVSAALRPINGHEKVLTFLAGLLSRFQITSFAILDVNGEAGALATLNGIEQFVTVRVRDGGIQEIFAVLNPEKLSHVRAGYRSAD